MNAIREMIREHQKATDASDGQMLSILCAYIGSGLYPNVEALEHFIVDHLELPPGEIPPSDMPRYDPRFNEQDLQSMWEGALGAGISRKEIAELVMDSWDLVSCIAACTVIDGEHSCEPLAEMLQRIDNKGDEEYITGEFLREHDDGDGYPALLDFAKRMGLIDEAEENITDLGREYMGSLL